MRHLERVWLRAAAAAAAAGSVRDAGRERARARTRFVLSAKKRTCYYYERQTDLKPKGYFFLNGCSVAPCKDAALERKHVRAARARAIGVGGGVGASARHQRCFHDLKPPPCFSR